MATSYKKIRVSARNARARYRGGRRACGLLLAFSLAAAHAADQPLTVAPAAGQAGAAVTLSAAGLQPGARALVWAGGPYVAGAVSMPGTARGVAVDGHYAYVAQDGRGMQVVDITDPAAPFVAGAAQTNGGFGNNVTNSYQPFGGPANAVATSGHYAYVAAGAVGLDVFDITVPTDPKLVGRVSPPAPINDVVVFGTLAYLAVDDGRDGLLIVDLSTPTAAKIIGATDTAAVPEGVAVSGDTLYAAEGRGGVQIIDVSDPRQPAVVGSAITAGDAAAVAVSGDDLYIADGGGGLQVLDISTPSAPRLLSSGRTPSAAVGVRLSGHYALVSDDIGGLVVMDIADPAAPRLAAAVDLPWLPGSVAVAGGYAYVATGQAGLQIVDVSHPASAMTLAQGGTADASSGIALAGGRAYVADGQGGLRAFDLTDPGLPAALNATAIPDTATDVVVDGHYAYVTAHYDGFQVVDLTAPGGPQVVGAVDTPGVAYALDVAGGYAYVADGRDGLQVIDIGQPQAPRILGTVATPQPALAVRVVAVDHSPTVYALVTIVTGTVQVVDVTDPTNPRIVASAPIPETDVAPIAPSATALVIPTDTADHCIPTAGRCYAYAAGGNDGLLVLDITQCLNPDTSLALAPDERAHVATPKAAVGIAVDNGMAYVTYVSGVEVVDVSNPLAPVAMGQVGTLGHPGGVALAGDRLYIADGTAGLVVMPTAQVSAETFAADPWSATVPTGLGSGDYDVTVLNPDGRLYRARNGFSVSGTPAGTQPIAVVSVQAPGTAVTTAVPVSSDPSQQQASITPRLVPAAQDQNGFAPAGGGTLNPGVLALLAAAWRRRRRPGR